MDILQHISWWDPHNTAPSSSSEAAHSSARKLFSPLEPIHGCTQVECVSFMIYCLRVYNYYRFWGSLRPSCQWELLCMCRHVCTCVLVHVNARGPPWVFFFGGPSSCLFLNQSRFALWFTSWASLAQGILLPLPRHGWNFKCLLPHLAFSCGFCRLNSGLCACRVSTLPTEPSLVPRECSVQTNYRITGTIHMEEYPCQLCILQRYWRFLGYSWLNGSDILSGSFSGSNHRTVWRQQNEEQIFSNTMLIPRTTVPGVG